MWPKRVELEELGERHRKPVNCNKNLVHYMEELFNNQSCQFHEETSWFGGWRICLALDVFKNRVRWPALGSYRI